MNIQINRKIRGTYRRSRSAERLLRSLGASGKLVGFKYLVYIAEKQKAPAAGEEKRRFMPFSPHYMPFSLQNSHKSLFICYYSYR